MMNRRQFISSSAAALVLSSVAGQYACRMGSKSNRGRIGIQLYSVKSLLPDDFEGTLKKLSEMGYSQVELYGFKGDTFLGRTVKEVSVIVKDLGMSISGAHTGSAILPEDTNAPEWDFWKKCAENLTSGGAQWAVQASFPSANSVDDLKRITAHFNRTGEVCKKGGIKFAYHNHYKEFEKIDDEVILDYLIKNTDPGLVSFQLDMGHTVNGGGDCVRYLRDYPKRFPLWHASDYDAVNRAPVWLGKGNVPYPALFDMAESSGLEVLTIEQETKVDVLAAIQSDFNYLKQFKWTKV